LPALLKMHTGTHFRADRARAPQTKQTHQGPTHIRTTTGSKESIGQQEAS